MKVSGLLDEGDIRGCIDAVTLARYYMRKYPCDPESAVIRDLQNLRISRIMSEEVRMIVKAYRSLEVT